MITKIVQGIDCAKRPTAPNETRSGRTYYSDQNNLVTGPKLAQILKGDNVHPKIETTYACHKDPLTGELRPNHAPVPPTSPTATVVYRVTATAHSQEWSDYIVVVDSPRLVERFQLGLPTLGYRSVRVEVINLKGVKV